MNALFQRRIGALVLWVLVAVLLALGQCQAWREGEDLSARGEVPAASGEPPPGHFRI